MNIKMPGDKTRAACDGCKAFKQATWNYGKLKTEDGSVAEGVMQAFCDSCGESLLIAQQSVYKITEAKSSKLGKVRTSLNLTAPLKDLTYSRVFPFGVEPERGPELLLRAFLAPLLDKPADLSEAIGALKSIDKRYLQGKKNQKVDISFPVDMVELLDTLASKTGLKRSEVMRRVLWATQRSSSIEQDVRKLISGRRNSA